MAGLLFTKEQISDAIDFFISEWETHPARNFGNANNEKSVVDEFYRGACHYFATALAVSLGVHDCIIHTLEADDIGFVHSVVEYLPLGKQRLSPATFLSEMEHPITFDIQSSDGRGIEQANFVFVSDPYEKHCPLVESCKFDETKVRWLSEQNDGILSMLNAYESGLADESEIFYWESIRETLSSCLLKAATLSSKKPSTFDI